MDVIFRMCKFTITLTYDTSDVVIAWHLEMNILSYVVFVDEH
jgi:hypothetical protein